MREVGAGPVAGTESDRHAPLGGRVGRRFIRSESTSLVGRERDQARVVELLAGSQVVTLTGPGGCGKTRLAGVVATWAAGEFADNAYWVDLAALRDPDMVAPVVASTLGVSEHPGELSSALVEQLRGRELLLVLDNCEHLVDVCAQLVSRLQRECPNVRVVATSRTPLAIESEWTYAVPPLSVPEPGAASAAEVARSAAARLFLVRARQVDFDFRLTDQNAPEVAEICCRLEGMPLAIELAAARIRMLSLSQIAAGLTDRFRVLKGSGRDVPARQRTLEASVAWSYELLDEAERLALARLSTFFGSFALDAAEAVVGGDGIETSTVLDLVTALVDHSLVEVIERGREARYRLLETIRLYADLRLTEFEDPTRSRDRHLAFFVDQAQRARTSLTGGSDPETWLERLEADIHDLRGAMNWAIEAQRPSDVLRIGEDTHGFWMLHGRYAELQRRLEAALAEPSITDVERLHGSTTASVVGVLGGGPAKGYAWADDAVTLARALDEEGALARALAYRAWCGYFAGEASRNEIRASCQEAARLVEQVGQPELGRVVSAYCGHLVLLEESLDEGRARLAKVLDDHADATAGYLDAHVHVFMGVWTAFTGDLEAARARARRTLTLSRRIGFPSGQAHAMVGLAVADLLAGDTAAVQHRLERALTVAQQHGLPLFELISSVWSAVVAYRDDELDTAQKLGQEALASARRVGQQWWAAALLWLLGMVALRSGRPTDARSTLQDARTRSCDPRYPLWFGRTLLGLARLETHDNDIDAAWELTHDALLCLCDYGDRVGTAEALEAVAGLSTVAGDARQTVRLLSAAQRFRSESGVARFPLEHDAFLRAHADARALLASEAFEHHWTEGAAMSLDEAVAYARRGRGKRDRPQTGWASLTPTEREVVRFVAAGCSNSEIAAQLFVSVSTVKTHLSHVYAKLPVEGRTDLAAQATQRAD